MKNKTVSILIVLFLLTVACKEKPKETKAQHTVESTEKTIKAPITIEKLKGSPAYTNASLILNKPSGSTVKSEKSEIDFDFEVNNYELGKQTDASLSSVLANSEKGQHIHFIVDNQPYSAHYEPTFKMGLSEGTHFLVAFLSRSYHESVKNPNAFVAKKIVVGNASTDALNVDFDKPTLIYSRPKGEYSGKDTDNLLLDFYLLNTTLSEGGNYVRATINGTEFKLTDWAPYVINGLPKGEVTIKLELLDKDGQSIPGDFNTVERKVFLKD